MPQTLHVVLCVECKRYQVQIVKKVKKWTCVCCNTKQSLQQVYFEGTGAECRNVVQKLNLAKHQQLEQDNQKVLAQVQAEEEPEIYNEESVGDEDFNSYEDIETNDEYYFEEGTEDNKSCEESTTNFDPDSDLVQQPSGVVSVAREKSKWSIFL